MHNECLVGRFDFFSRNYVACLLQFVYFLRSDLWRGVLNPIFNNPRFEIS